MSRPPLPWRGRGWVGMDAIARADHSPQNLGVLRHMALNLFARNAPKDRCEKSSGGPPGATPSWPRCWLNFEMRLPWCGISCQISTAEFGVADLLRRETPLQAVGEPQRQGDDRERRIGLP
jgi:hypothetical protein